MKKYNNGTEWVLEEYQGKHVNVIIKPISEGEPTEEEIKTLVETHYAFKRMAEYPSIPDQLDMIYHDMDNWKAEIKKVKDKYPKT